MTTTIAPHLTPEQRILMALEAPETRVIHVNDMPNHPDAVYIGRSMPRKGLKGSPWGNPYQIKNHRRPDARAFVINLYRVELTTGGKSQLARLPELRGKPLACWCRREGEERTAANACHGDVLKELLDTYTDEQLRAMATGEVQS